MASNDRHRRSNSHAPSAQLHGSIPHAELRDLGISPEDILDFSATVNPYPLPAVFREEMACVPLAHYPDIDCWAAVDAISNFHGIPQRHIAITAGMTEVIFMLPFLFRTAVQWGPTYEDYASSYARHKVSVKTMPFPQTDSEFDGCIDELRKSPFEILIICNPNNPTGLYLSPARIHELCCRFPQSILCIDESYQEMGAHCKSVLTLVSTHKNLLVLKSLTKPFGIGGIRAAYAVSSGSLAEEIKKMGIPWGVSAIAQALIPQIFRHYGVFEKQWHCIWDRKKELQISLKEMHIQVDRGRCPFVLASVTDPSLLRWILLHRYKIAVRDCTSFGMPNHLRVMPAEEKRNSLLLSALKEIYPLTGS